MQIIQGPNWYNIIEIIMVMCVINVEGSGCSFASLFTVMPNIGQNVSVTARAYKFVQL